MVERVGLFGGTFNPIHNGHLKIASAVASQLDLGRVIVLPSGRPPHKSLDELIDARHRAEMVKLAIVSKPLFELSLFDLERDGPTFTIDTVHHFQAILGDATSLYWIIGADSLGELPTWRRVQELVRCCQIVSAARKGCEVIDWDDLAAVFDEIAIQSLRRGVLQTPVVEISSTQVRRRISQSLPIDDLVPADVAAYIAKNSLYCD